MKTSRKMLFGMIATCSILAASEAMSTECSIFNGVWKDVGKGVIAYIGDGKFVLYNGNYQPSLGDCLSNTKVQVRFKPSGVLAEGEIRLDNDSIIYWSNGSTWKRVSRSVNFPSDIPQ